MTAMDVFKSDAFSMTSLTAAIQKVDTKPQLLGQLGLFKPTPSRTRNVFIERRADGLALIPTTEIGQAPTELRKNLRDAIPFQTVRLAKGFTLMAEEVQGIRQFGSETELLDVMTEYSRHINRVKDDLELTREFHRLGALQGKLLDADGVTVIYDFFTELGIAEPAAVNFALTTTTTDVRQKCKDVVRAMVRSAKGALAQGSSIHALCGDAFYDSFTHHPNVEKFYINWLGASELRANTGAFGAFTFEGITFHNYQGTDDTSTVAVPTNEAKFFPVGGNDVFRVAQAPAEFGPYVNTMGQETYAMNIIDKDREAWTRGEVYAYPLYMCQRPEVLRKAVRS